MGSDRSPQVLFEAVIQAAKQLDSTATLTVIATPELIDSFSSLIPHLLGGHSISSAKVNFVPAPDVINMHEEPLTAFKSKKGSSLIIGMKLLRKKTLDAFVTAGNTGALITCATLMMSPLPNIQRPALLATLPTESGNVAVIDIGGNVLCKAHHLVQFAAMGAAFQRCREGIEIPRIGLLNIGVESKKGTAVVRHAYRILSELVEKDIASGKERIQFIGNIEGRDVFQGKVDVLVTDGFTGNVLLKTSEGVASFILEYIKKNLGHVPTQQFQHGLAQLQRHFNYAEYPGAIVLGIDGVVVKCHGDATSKAMLNGIKGAANLVEKRLVEKIKAELALQV